jgi:hypothetical protein
VPQSALDVNGGVSVGAYAGANAAPANGLVVSGSIGIGTATPQSPLDVKGGVSLGAYGGVNPAPNNGLIVSGNVGIGTNSPNATLQVNGSVSRPISPNFGGVDMSASPDAYYTVVELTPGQTVTLPNIGGSTGKIYVIVASFATGSLNISTDAGDGGYRNNFDVITSTVPAGASVTLQSDGLHWWQIR